MTNKQDTRAAPTLGSCSVPDGARGPWTIDTFTVSKEDAALINLRAMLNHSPEHLIVPGRYRRLRHARRGVVMSTVPGEVSTHQPAYERATGRVLIAGLGLGMIVEAILRKPDVRRVLVVEIDRDIITMVAPHFGRNPRFRCVNQSIFDFTLGAEAPFDFAWFDIWDDICADNLLDMRALRSRGFARHSACWSEPQALRQKRREARA